MNAKLLSLFTLFSIVAAQSGSGAATATVSGGAATPSGAAQLPQCVLGCLKFTVHDLGCDDPGAPQCDVCSFSFIDTANICESSCTPQERAFAKQLEQSMCEAGATASRSAPATRSATILLTGAPGPVSSATRPAPYGASASVSKLASSGAIGSAPSSAAGPSSASPLVAQGVWAMAAGILSIAVVL